MVYSTILLTIFHRLVNRIIIRITCNAPNMTGLIRLWNSTMNSIAISKDSTIFINILVMDSSVVSVISFIGVLRALWL